MPATHEGISEIMASDSFSRSDKWVVKWQFGYLGDFDRALAALLSRADGYNLDRLARTFPDEVAGYRSWMQGDLGDRLRAAGLGI